jgi:hypothetical protein
MNDHTALVRAAALHGFGHLPDALDAGCFSIESNDSANTAHNRRSYLMM